MPKLNFNSMKQKLLSFKAKFQESKKRIAEMSRAAAEKAESRIDFSNYEASLQAVIDYYNIDSQIMCIKELEARLVLKEDESNKIKIS